MRIIRLYQLLMDDVEQFLVKPEFSSGRFISGKEQTFDEKDNRSRTVMVCLKRSRVYTSSFSCLYRSAMKNSSNGNAYWLGFSWQNLTEKRIVRKCFQRSVWNRIF